MILYTQAAVFGVCFPNFRVFFLESVPCRQVIGSAAAGTHILKAEFTKLHEDRLYLNMDRLLVGR